MKKKIMITIVCLSSLLLFAACSKEPPVLSDEAAPVQEAQSISKEEPENADLAEVKIWNPRALSYQNVSYLCLGEAIYQVDTEQKAEKILECRDAAGGFREGQLYFAVWAQDGQMKLVKVGEDGTVLEAGDFGEKGPVSSIDFYEDMIFLRYKLGNTEGYYLDENGNLAEQVPEQELPFYQEENRAAEMKIENPQDTEAALNIPQHIINAGASLKAYGKEFLSRHISGEEGGKQELIAREGGQDTVLFSCYGEAFLAGNTIFYYGDADQTEIMAYDLQTRESRLLSAFEDGFFTMTDAAEHAVYGIWKRAGQEGEFFTGIELENGAQNVYFEMEDHKDSIVLEERLYFVEPDGDSLSWRELK